MASTEREPITGIWGEAFEFKKCVWGGSSLAAWQKFTPMITWPINSVKLPGISVQGSKSNVRHTFHHEAGIAVAWVEWPVACDCVCFHLCVYSLKGKRLELSIPNLVHIMLHVRPSARIDVQVKRSKFKVTQLQTPSLWRDC